MIKITLYAVVLIVSPNYKEQKSVFLPQKSGQPKDGKQWQTKRRQGTVKT
jgi:hypothetical protein